MQSTHICTHSYLYPHIELNIYAKYANIYAKYGGGRAAIEIFLCPIHNGSTALRKNQ